MAENQIKIEVTGKVATLKEQNFELVGGNDDYKVVFDFDEEWNAYAVKTAVFVFGDSSVKKIFTGNVCDGVPISNATGCFIGVFVGSKATTTAAYVECADYSITDISGKPADPSKSVYDQLIELFNKVIEEEAIKAIPPTVNVEPIENGNRVTITDINATHSFDVMNGEKGEQGEAGKDGKDYVLTDADKTEIAEKVDADFDKKVSEIESEVDELKESKLNSAGISHSCSESRDTVSLDICAGGVVLRADQSRGSITIGGTDGHNPISIYSDSIAGIPYDDIVTKDGKDIAILKMRVATLESATLDFVEDSAIAYQKIVPTNALPYAQVTKIGGNTVRTSGVTVEPVFVSALVSEGANGILDTLNIPEESRPAHGISKDACDYIEWKADGTRKKYECIGYATPPTIAKVHTRSNGIPYITFTVSDVKENTKILSSFENYHTGIYTDNDMSIYYSGGGFVVNDSRFTSVEEANRILNGLVVYYELATPIVTDISNILPADNFIKVEGGGTITAVNEYGNSAPTTINYMVDIGG